MLHYTKFNHFKTFYVYLLFSNHSKTCKYAMWQVDQPIIIDQKLPKLSEKNAKIVDSPADSWLASHYTCKVIMPLLIVFQSFHT